MSEVKPEHVIAVSGISFCGSTVLNLVLGSHPAIHGAGELHKLFMPQKHPRCSVHQYECEQWTPEALASVRKEGLYAQIAEKFGKSVISDTSKNVWHHEELRPVNEDVNYVYIMLVKHPLRHSSSYVTNKFLPNNNLLKDVDVGTLSDEIRNEAVEYVAKRLKRIVREYGEMREGLTKLGGDGGFTFLRYEDFVTNPLETLAPILAKAGLEPHPAMPDFVNQVHHPIGGNRGPHYQINKNLSTARFTEFRKDFYSGSALSLDDKFRRTFTPEQIEQIVALPQYQALCEDLGYDPDPATV